MFFKKLYDFSLELSLPVHKCVNGLCEDFCWREKFQVIELSCIGFTLLRTEEIHVLGRRVINTFSTILTIR